MKPIQSDREMPVRTLEGCHGGEGAFRCRSILDGLGSARFPFMHRDDMPAGSSIGEHTHERDEEIYYLLSGEGTLTYDGQVFAMRPGDVSLCLAGHSHGFAAVTDCELIVVGSFPDR